MSGLKAGFYKVCFHAALPGAGGIVTVENGKIRGGDDQYLYSGTLVEKEDSLSSRVTVTAMSDRAISVFGSNAGKFSLDLVGKSNFDRFYLAGPAPFPGSAGIEISGEWIAGFETM